MVPETIVDAMRAGDIAAIDQWFSTGTRDPDEISIFGHNLLNDAVSYPHPHDLCDVIRCLLNHGANANVGDHVTHDTPLHKAAGRGYCDVAILLLDHGARIDARSVQRTRNSVTPLMHAALTGGCDMIRVLLSRGAELDARDQGARGQNAEFIAHQSRDEHKASVRIAATALLRDVRVAGGWKPYVRDPRIRLLALRILCDGGRASTDDDLLARVFGAAPPSPSSPKRARLAATTIPACYRRKIVWRIFEYWRSDRDSRY